LLMPKHVPLGCGIVKACTNAGCMAGRTGDYGRESSYMRAE
jgi:hypothetical protein